MIHYTLCINSYLLVASVDAYCCHCYTHAKIKMTLLQKQVAAWLSGNALVLVNVVAVRRAWLSHPGLLSLAIPLWVGTMSTGGGLGHL